MSAVISREGLGGIWSLQFSDSPVVIEQSYFTQYLREIAWDAGVEDINIFILGELD